MSQETPQETPHETPHEAPDHDHADAPGRDAAATGGPAPEPAPVKREPKKSAYDLSADLMREEIVVRTLAVIVDNEAGVLARVIGLFSGRGYNIESLTVAEVDHEKHTSRITIVTSGTPMVIDQIKAQLGRMVPVRRVADLTIDGPSVERELAMVKVTSTGDHRVEALRLKDAFRAHVVDATLDSFVFEVTGAPTKIDAFVELMGPLGLVEVTRTGVVAIRRGAEGM